MTQLAFDFNHAVAALPTKEQIGIIPRQEQLGLVYDCLRRGGEYTFDDMSAYLKSAGMKSRETSISARIRDLNRLLRPNGFEIRWKYVRKDSTNTVYWMDSL